MNQNWLKFGYLETSIVYNTTRTVRPHRASKRGPWIWRAWRRVEVNTSLYYDFQLRERGRLPLVTSHDAHNKNYSEALGRLHFVMNSSKIYCRKLGGGIVLLVKGGRSTYRVLSDAFPRLYFRYSLVRTSASVYLSWYPKRSSRVKKKLCHVGALGGVGKGGIAPIHT